MITIDLDATLKRYGELRELVTSERADSFNKLLTFMEDETDWLKSPASTKYHLCTPHGLLYHSCNVAETLIRLCKVMDRSIPIESAVIVGLCHDMGKAGLPGKPQYVPNEPTERQKQFGYGPTVPYSYNTDLIHVEHEVRSLQLILPRFELTEEEFQAILIHNGQYVDSNERYAHQECKLALLLHWADVWSADQLEKGM